MRTIKKYYINGAHYASVTMSGEDTVRLINENIKCKTDEKEILDWCNKALDGSTLTREHFSITASIRAVRPLETTAGGRKSARQ